MDNKILKISGTGDYRVIADAIDRSGLLAKNKAYSSGFGHDIRFIIDATQGVQQEAIINLLTAEGMQISSSKILEGTVPSDPDAYED